MSKSQSRQLQATKAFLIFLLSTASMTGISFIDDQIVGKILQGFGTVAYVFVGFLFSHGIIKSKQEGLDSYAAVFVVLILATFALYQGVTFVINWISNWPLWIKIALLSVGILSALLVLIYLIVSYRKSKVEQSVRS
jgi:hypothetical protein